MTLIHCDGAGRDGRKCRGVLAGLPGDWVKVRELDKGESVLPPQGFVFCPCCNRKYAIRPAVTAQPKAA